jgi:hypothetical protein
MSTFVHESPISYPCIVGDQVERLLLWQHLRDMQTYVHVLAWQIL